MLRGGTSKASNDRVRGVAEVSDCVGEPSVADHFQYDPSGMPTLSGQSNSYPFLYQGMEHEFLEPNQFYYSGEGQFYSAQIQRGFSIAGAQGTSGPGGAGPRRAHHGHHHGGGGAARRRSQRARRCRRNGGCRGGRRRRHRFGRLGRWYSSSLPGLLEDFYNFFNDLFGGGGGQSLPPNYFVYQARLQRARRHPQYPDIDGAAIDIVLNQSPAAPEFCADPHPCAEPPLTRTGSPAPCMACGCTACATIPMTVTGYDNGYESTGEEPWRSGITGSLQVARSRALVRLPHLIGLVTEQKCLCLAMAAAKSRTEEALSARKSYRPLVSERDRREGLGFTPKCSGERMSIIGDTFVPHLISVKEQSNSAQIVNVGATLCTSSKVPNTGIRSGTTIFLLAALILAAAQSVFAQSQDIVPLKAGSIWKYRGRACWTIADSTRTKCSNIRWEMRVLQSVTENGKTAALVAGFPLDLAWYDPTTKPGYTVVSEDSQGLYFKSASSKHG